jgi:hypothetical protein
MRGSTVHICRQSYDLRVSLCYVNNFLDDKLFYSTNQVKIDQYVSRKRVIYHWFIT